LIFIHAKQMITRRGHRPLVNSILPIRSRIRIRLKVSLDLIRLILIVYRIKTSIIFYEYSLNNFGFQSKWLSIKRFNFILL
jgi:hypothetical protein